MKLNYVNREDVFGGTKGNWGFCMTKLQALLDEFSKSDADLAELVPEPGEYSSPTSAYLSAKQAVSRFGYAFRVRMLKGRIYLDKK